MPSEMTAFVSPDIANHVLPFRTLHTESRSTTFPAESANRLNGTLCHLSESTLCQPNLSTRSPFS
jgi:hypothetical protein